MLQAIRDRAQGIFAWIILLMICVPFVLWGIQNYLGGGKEQPVATVGDHEFFQVDVNRAYEQGMQGQDLQSLILGGEDEAKLKKQALDELIDNEVLNQAAEKAGIVSTDGLVRQVIESLPFFQTDGKFDRQKFEQLLAAQNMSQASYIAQLRKAMLMEQYRQGIMSSDFVTDYELDRVWRIQKEKRTLEYLIVPVTPSEEPVPDSEISKYYDEHQNEFENPEQVSVQYLELDLAAIAKTITPTEEQLAAYFEEHKDRYTTAERRKVSHILIAVKEDATPEQVAAAKKKAEEARQQLLNGEDFAKLAAVISDDSGTAKQGGDLGLIAPGVMQKPFEDAALALNQGEVSEPVRTTFGFHLIKVTELEASQTKPFKEVEQELKTAYQRDQAENRFYQQVEDLSTISYENPGSLDAAAQALGLEVQDSELFTRAEGSGIATEQKVRDMAFSDDVLAGNNSSIVELAADKALVLRVKQHLPASVKPLAEVNAAIIDHIHSEKSLAETEKRAKAMYKDLQKGQSLVDIAAAHHLELFKPEPVGRDDQKLHWELREALFTTAKPEDGRTMPLLVALQSGEQVVANVLAVEAGDPKSIPDQEKTKTVDRMATILGQLAFNTYKSELREQADIDIKQPEN